MADFSKLHYIKGDPIQAKGKVVVVEFWATWCPPCVKSIPHLTEIAHQFGDKIQVVGISTETDVAAIQKFVAGKGKTMDYTVALDVQGVFNDAFMEKYEVRGIPHAFVVGKDGKVMWHGHPMDQDFVPHIQQALNAADPVDYSLLSAEQIAGMSVSELKKALTSLKVDFSDCFEKSELVQRLRDSI